MAGGGDSFESRVIIVGVGSARRQRRQRKGTDDAESLAALREEGALGSGNRSFRRSALEIARYHMNARNQRWYEYRYALPTRPPAARPGSEWAEQWVKDLDDTGMAIDVCECACFKDKDRWRLRCE